MEETLESLYREYRGFVINYARMLEPHDRYAREELAAETWLKATRFFHKYEQGTKFKSWIAKILYNTALNRWRNRQRDPAAKLIPLEKAWNISIAASDDGFGDEIIAAMETAPPEMMMIFIKKYVEGMKVREIAEEMGIAQGTVLSRLYRVRKKMKSEISRRVVGWTKD